MKIRSVKIQNFYSFKRASVALDTFNGVVVIKGKNKDVGGSNGSGKSVLVEAIYFGLTGKTIRKSTEDTLVNNVAKKHCRVEVGLQNDMKIVRQKKPTKLEFFVGEENLTQDTVAATQRLIDDTLNINYKVLLASMFFGQSNNLNFLDCSPDDKRLIIKNFLNLEDIFDMRDRIKSFKSQYNQSIKQQDAVVREHQSTISSLDEKIVNIAQMKEDYDSYDSSFLSLSLEDVIDQEVKEHERQAKLSALTRTLHLSSKDFNSLTYRLKNVDALRVCPTCNQEVLEKEDKESLLSNIAKLQKEEIELKKEYSNVSSRTYAPAVSSKDFAKLISYKELCRDEINYQEIRTEIQHKIEEAELRKINNQASYDVMRFWEKALSEHGLIKYIIRNILDFFNEKANYYLSYLSDGGYSIQFDEELSEKIETGKRIVPYISLSGGEQRKINLAVMLSLKDLLLFTDKNQSDIIFFDEVAENLDEQGVAGLYSLLQEIKKDKTIFVITHNKYLKTLLDSAPRLAIIKEKGTSHILEI